MRGSRWLLYLGPSCILSNTQNQQEKPKGEAVMKKLLMALLACLFLSPVVFAQDFFKLVQSGTPEQVQAAIDKGENVNAETQGGNSPLMFAAQHNQNAEVIAILLKAGALVNKNAKVGGMTPLMNAATSNANPEVITVLLKAGANVNAVDDYMITSLMHAAKTNPNAEVITILLKSGAKLDMRNNTNQTPLMAAAGANNPEVVTALLKGRAKLNDTDSRGMTALMWAAAYNQNPEVAMTLLKAGANGKLKSSDDKTAFDYAEGNEKLKGTDAYEALRKVAGK